MIKLNTKNKTWNFKLLFDNDTDPRMEEERKVIQEECSKFIKKWENNSEYLKEPKVLKEALDEYERLSRKYIPVSKEHYYFKLKQKQNQTDPNIKAKFNKITDFTKKIVNDLQFFTLRLSKIPKETQETLLAAKDLNDYKHFLEKTFAAASHLLSEPEEKILTLKETTAHTNWVKMTSSLLSKEERIVFSEKGKKEKKTLNEISALTRSQKPKVRDTAAKAFSEILNQYIDVAEAEINSVLANKKTDDELRKFDRPDAASHLNDDIDSEIVDSLIKCVSQRFDIPARFYKLKAKLLGVKKLKYHERNVPYGKIEKIIPYEEGVKLIDETFRELDPEFSNILRSYLENGQIDVFPKKGKTSGAFCTANSLTQPTYILLNYAQKLDDILTIAHELGHGINNELMRKNQNALNFDISLATAEVASTFMEDFVLRKILKESDDELKLALMVSKINDDIGTIFRQVACYKFEQDLHTEFRIKGYLSKEEIAKLFKRQMSSYMGTYILQTEGAENFWVYWGHIRYFFYVYSYASGQLISKSLQNSVYKDPKFIEKVKDFLSAGTSESPKNIFKKIGIDITDENFWNNGLNEIDSLLKETEKLAKKLGKV